MSGHKPWSEIKRRTGKTQPETTEDWVAHQTEAAQNTQILPEPVGLHAPVLNVVGGPKPPRRWLGSTHYVSTRKAARRLAWHIRWFRLLDFYWYRLRGRCPSCHSKLISVEIEPYMLHAWACPHYERDPLHHRRFQTEQIWTREHEKETDRDEDDTDF